MAPSGREERPCRSSHAGLQTGGLARSRRSPGTLCPWKRNAKGKQGTGSSGARVTPGSSFLSAASSREEVQTLPLFSPAMCTCECLLSLWAHAHMPAGMLPSGRSVPSAVTVFPAASVALPATGRLGVAGERNCKRLLPFCLRSFLASLGELSVLVM